MVELGYDTEFYGTVGDTPAAWGNRIAFSYLIYGLSDGANEVGDFENEYYTPINPPLVVQQPGNPSQREHYGTSRTSDFTASTLRHNLRNH